MAKTLTRLKYTAITATAAGVYLSGAPVLAAPSSPPPKIISMAQLNAFRAPRITQSTKVTLPDSVDYILVERFDPQDHAIKSEIRWYTYQQVFFWTLASVALGFL